MTFEEWYDGYMYWHDEDEVDQEHLIRIAQRAWEAATEVAYNDQGLTIAYMKGYFDGKEKRNEPRL